MHYIIKGLKALLCTDSYQIGVPGRGYESELTLADIENSKSLLLPGGVCWHKSD